MRLSRIRSWLCALTLPSMVACTGLDAPEDRGPHDEPTTEGVDVASFAGESVFTELDGCDFSVDLPYYTEPEGTDVRTCPGVGSYRLEIRKDRVAPNAQEVPRVIADGVDFGIRLPDDAYLMHSATAGPRPEWRVERGAEGGEPYALILRRTFMAYPKADLTEGEDFLAVVKLDGAKTCLAGYVEATKGAASANVLARRIADAARTGGCPETVAVTYE